VNPIVGFFPLLFSESAGSPALWFFAHDHGPYCGVEHWLSGVDRRFLL